jgi:hypothetical protein
MGDGTRGLNERSLLYTTLRNVMDSTTLIIIILVLLLVGGGGYYGRGRWY